MATTRPSWAPEGIHSIQLNKWPNEEDGSPQQLTRIFAFESRVQYLVDKFVIKGKVLWGKLDVNTGTMWVRYDHLVANQDATRVLCETIWITFADFEARFPRAQMPFRFSATALFNKPSTIKNPNREMDDHEPDESDSAPEDFFDDDDDLDHSQTSRIINEERAKAWWRRKFGAL
ncbi:hypothetical protein M433DRAFT_158856 [Acidomyces richmondensis BFW]|nr:hypothetical protein M433DRAFT_158856 [Acidomyces richmondensis BFW]